MWFLAGGWLVIINLWAGLATALDKRRAVDGGRRIPEARLILLAGLGGSPAVLVVCRLMRHKIRKPDFLAPLLLVTAVQAGCVAAVVLRMCSG